MAQQTKLEQLRKQVHTLLHDEENPVARLFAQLEGICRVPRLYLFLGVIGVVVLYLIFGHGTGLLVNLIGFVYPAYKSCKAIDTDDKDDDTQWLTYWVVYAAFGLLEYFTDILLSWIPFYFLAKCAFLIWCMLPMKNNGAFLIYTKIIGPFVRKHEGKIDEVVSMTEALAREGGKEFLSKAKDAAGNISLADMQGVKDRLSDWSDTLEQEGNKKEN